MFSRARPQNARDDSNRILHTSGSEGLIEWTVTNLGSKIVEYSEKIHELCLQL